MGHYASEMCGGPTRVEAEQDGHKWMVDGRTLQAMLVSDFDKKYEYVESSNGMLWPGQPELMRWNSTLFDTLEEALAHRPAVIDAQIKRQQQVLHEANVHLQQLLMKRETMG